MSEKKYPDDPSVLAQLANQKSKGKRPGYFDNAMAENHYAITMALVSELAVARERVDTLERILHQKGLLDVEELDQFVPDESASNARQTAQMEYCARIFRALQQHVEAMQQHELSVEEMAKRLGETELGQPAGSDSASGDSE